MKKEYNEPEMNVVYLEYADIITASGCTPIPGIGDFDELTEG